MPLEYFPGKRVRTLHELGKGEGDPVNLMVRVVRNTHMMTHVPSSSYSGPYHALTQSEERAKGQIWQLGIEKADKGRN